MESEVTGCWWRVTGENMKEVEGLEMRVEGAWERMARGMKPELES
jgi:hypothetical protein